MGGINSNVVLMLHGDGTDGGTAIIDWAGASCTVLTSATTVSAFKKFGTGGLRYGGVGITNTSKICFASDFTIDAFVYPTDFSGGSYALLLGAGGNDTTRWMVGFRNSVAFYVQQMVGNSVYVSLFASTNISLNTWHHVAWQRAGSIWRCFLSGQSVTVVHGAGTASNLTYALSIASTINAMVRGDFWAGCNLIGYCDEIRVTKGVALWSDNFTPPTEAYTMDLPVATVTFGDDGAKVEATWSGEGAPAATTTTISASDNPATITLTAEGASGTNSVHNVGYAAVITMTMYANTCQPIAAYIETTLDQVTFEGDAYKVLEAELSPITFAATARTDIVGGLEKFLENIEASLHGSQEILGSINSDLRPITLSAASLYRHILGSINGTLHPIILTEQIKGIKGISCTLSVTLPNIELSATAIQNIHASLLQDLPAITAELEIESLIFEIIAMNLLNKAITNFSNYPFNSFCYFDGKYFGCARDGIYELTGVDDFGADISAYVQFGLLDLEVTLLKRIRHAYLGFKSSGQLSLTITTDDGESYSYTTEHFNGNYGGQKVKFGKGFKDRYIQLKIANTDGCTFALDKTRVFDEPISHRRR